VDFNLWFLRAAWAYNRVRFRLLERALRGRVEFGEGCDVWAGSFAFQGPGRAVIGDGCVIERGLFPLCFETEAGALIELGAGVWARGKYRPNLLTAHAGARLEVGPGSLLNGCIISARQQVEIGARAMISWGVTILDSNQHPIDNDEELKVKPVRIGDHVLLAAGVIVLPGSSIGSHTVIGAGSLVAGEVPDHVVAAGNPLRVIRKIGDRDRRP